MVDAHDPLVVAGIDRRGHSPAACRRAPPAAVTAGAALELTIARYYTPSGEDISNVGVVPQIHAVDDPRTPSDDALTTALRVLARPAS